MQGRTHRRENQRKNEKGVQITFDRTKKMYVFVENDQSIVLMY